MSKDKGNSGNNSQQQNGNSGSREYPKIIDGSVKSNTLPTYQAPSPPPSPKEKK